MFDRKIADRMRYWLDSRPSDDSGSCGDFAECFPLGADRRAILIGDVAGRGATAGVAASSLHTYARSALLSAEPLRRSLTQVDRFFTRALMCDAVPLASLFIAVADTRDGVLEYASAGHEPALLFTSRARHVHLEPTGPLLGLGSMRSPEFKQQRVQLPAESFLALVTDGITEARRYESNRPRFFGSTGVVRAIAKAQRLQTNPARAVCDAANEHSDRRDRDDATTLVVDLGLSPPIESFLCSLLKQRAS